MGVLDQSTRGWLDVAPMPTGRAYMGFACVGEAGGGGDCSSLSALLVEELIYYRTTH